MKEVKSLSSGKIQISVLTRADYEDLGSAIKGVAFDIYHNLPEFNEDIYWIQYVKPIEGKTTKDVIDEYTKAEGSDKFIFAQAGTITYDYPASGNPDELIGIINGQKMDLFRSYFHNIIFNRKMAHSFGNNDTFIYSNTITENFIANNKGDATSGKIINRIVSEGLLE